jgi:hypothetical protein
MTYYYCVMHPNVDVVVFSDTNHAGNNQHEVFVTTAELHSKAFVGQVASRFSQDFTTASTG